MAQITQNRPIYTPRTDHPTRLVPQQKSDRKPLQDPPEQAFRFRRDTATRAFWLNILPRVTIRPNETERFRACGSDAWVEYSPSTGKTRITSKRCMLRICPACRRAYARRLADRTEQLFKHAERRAPLFLTLTLKPSARALADQIAYLRSCFRRLRATAPWKKAIDYGLAVVEVTRGRSQAHWHAHLHIVAWGRYFPKPTLSNLWKRITCGSYIVDVQRCKSTNSLRHYVSDYVTKPPSEACWSSFELAQEWYLATTRHHWIIRFGKRSKVPKVQPPDKPRDWQTLGKLTDFIPWMKDHTLQEAIDLVRMHKATNQYQEITQHVIDST